MGQSAYYHNISKDWYNENDVSDAAENSEVGDKIKISFRGNALMIDLLKEDLKIESKGEHEEERNKFLSYFKKYHNINFK